MHPESLPKQHHLGAGCRAAVAVYGSLSQLDFGRHSLTWSIQKRPSTSMGQLDRQRRTYPWVPSLVHLSEAQKKKNYFVLLPAHKSDLMCHSVAIAICPYSFSSLQRKKKAPQGAYGLHLMLKKCHACQPILHQCMYAHGEYSSVCQNVPEICGLTPTEKDGSVSLSSRL